MAIAIKSVPTLKDNVATLFVKNAKSASEKRGTVNFSKQIKTANKILQKASI